MHIVIKTSSNCPFIGNNKNCDVTFSFILKCRIKHLLLQVFIVLFITDEASRMTCMYVMKTRDEYLSISKTSKQNGCSTSPTRKFALYFLISNVTQTSNLVVATISNFQQSYNYSYPLKEDKWQRSDMIFWLNHQARGSILRPPVLIHLNKTEQSNARKWHPLEVTQALQNEGT